MGRVPVGRWLACVTTEAGAEGAERAGDAGAAGDERGAGDAGGEGRRDAATLPGAQPYTAHSTGYSP